MEEVKRLQHKLIPVNIVVMIIALVAALSILFAPLLKIDVGVVTAEIAKLQESDKNEDSEENVGSIDYMSTIADCLKDMKLSVSTLSLAKTAFSEEPAQQLTGIVANELKKSEDKIIVSVAVEMLPQLIEDIDVDVDIDVENIDVESVLGKFDGLLNAENEEQSDQAIADLVEEIQRQAVSTEGVALIPDEAKSEMQNIIKDYYEQAKEILADQELTMESFICVTISKIMNDFNIDNPGEGAKETKISYIADVEPSAPETTSPESGNDGIYTTYEDLINGMLSANGSEQENAMAKLNETIDNYKPAMQIAVYAMFGFAAVWLILFIFALLHLFAKNKRFTMWYVKLFGFYPCLIFGLAPMLSGIIVKTLITDVAVKSSVTAILGAISSLTWISGACYVLLWLVSIFWAHPIKKKIRALK